MIDRIVILGGTGDLTRRSVVPAIARLLECGLMPGSTSITAVGRRDWDDVQYRTWLASADAGSPDAALPAVRYRRADVGNAIELRNVLEPIDDPVVVYLALPPATFAPAIEGLAAAGLPAGSRVVVEKPFGEDEVSAQRLNDLLHRALAEDSIYRIDHFLHKQTVQNVLGLRFANRLLEPLWTAEHIERVDIRWDETLALEGRAGYYDRTGALRDVIQNHLLQLFALVAMEAPAAMTASELRGRKVDVLRRVRPFDADGVRHRTARARYTAGEVAGRSIPDYIAEPGVDAALEAETFARIELFVDNDRWAGVPFSLQTGKALGADVRRIEILFRPSPRRPFGQVHEAGQNLLTLSIDPDDIRLRLNINGPGDPFDLEPIDVRAELAGHPLPAYARLLLDVLDGDPILSIGAEEAVEQWRIIDPIIKGWRHGHRPMETYPAGWSGEAGPLPAS